MGSIPRAADLTSGWIPGDTYLRPRAAPSDSEHMLVLATGRPAASRALAAHETAVRSIPVSVWKVTPEFTE